MLMLLLESAVRSFLLGAVVWAGLKAFRVRNTRAQITAWTMVLIASLSMPLLMQRLKLPVPALPAPAIKFLSQPQSPPAPHSVAEQVSQGTTNRPAVWPVVALSAYTLVAGTLLLRLLIGLMLTSRLRRRARMLHENWTSGLDVRVSPAISVPLTFGSTVLVPADYSDWPPRKLQAVLSHERSHVRSGDFYLQLLAGIHRVVFWFSPLSWWLWSRLASLAEAASDDAAIEALQDRSSYVEILLEFARVERPVPAGVAMARPSTLGQRVERILAQTNGPARMGRRKQALVAAIVLPVIAFSSGWSWHTQGQQSKESAPAPSSPSAPAVAAEQRQSPGTPQNGAALTVRIYSQGSPYLIVSGDSLTINGASKVMMTADSLTVNGPKRDGQPRARHEQTIEGDHIWFEHDGKSYSIVDVATVERAKGFFRPVEELARKQGELGSQLGKLGLEQGKIGQEQGRLGREQGHDGQQAEAASEKQSKLGEKQSELGEQQSLLGERQSKLADEQEHAAENALQNLRGLINDALRSGAAKPRH